MDEALVLRFLSMGGGDPGQVGRTPLHIHLFLLHGP